MGFGLTQLGGRRAVVLKWTLVGLETSNWAQKDLIEVG